ncbi:SHOCT domain-containing protein [Flavobacterium psychrophilum]|nr:SHOCT domain-containing protein [Flavobacterium psychrophilum]
MGLFGNLFEKKEKPQGFICNYGVTYKGGHPDYPKDKIGEIDFCICEDRFEFQPTLGTKKWFNGLNIPFNSVLELNIVQRQVGSMEGLLGGLDSRQLNQANNIHISYNLNGQNILLRLEMLTGITVMGQAKKCLELEDRLRTNNIKSKFVQKKLNENSSNNNIDFAEQIEKLSKLYEKGILTKEEFETKKTDLLNKI